MTQPFGKQWAAVIVGEVLGNGNATPQKRYALYFNSYNWTEADIAAQYPTLSWDIAYATAGTPTQYLPEFPLSVGGYANYEAEMLDTTLFVGGGGGKGFGWAGPNYFIRWQNGSWRGGWQYDGAPGPVWALFPDNPTLAETTVAPWDASVGAGLIRYQRTFYKTPDGTIVNDTQYPDPPSPLPANGDTGTISVGSADITYIFMPNPDTSATTEPSDGEGDGVTDNDVTIRCWGFSLHGHDFYVLRLGTSGTFVYDLATGQWSEWESAGRTNWRLHCGQNWIGMAADLAISGHDIVAGDDATGTLWLLDPELTYDLRSGDFTGKDHFTREVTGGIMVTGRDTIRCNAVQLDCDVGYPAFLGAQLTLEYSDDLGTTFVTAGTLALGDSEFTTPAEFRGLGTIRSPGRVFRITDNGMAVRIGGMSLR